jgi:hypothetical protein
MPPQTTSRLNGVILSN